MIVLSRKVGEEIYIGDNIRIVVIELAGQRVRLGVVAPKDVTVDRKEIAEKKLAPKVSPVE
jgi:carbon storage regulator